MDLGDILKKLDSDIEVHQIATSCIQVPPPLLILKNKGDSDIEISLDNYKRTFGFTDTLWSLEAISFCKGCYEFFFNKEVDKDITDNWKRFVEFILIHDSLLYYDCEVHFPSIAYSYSNKFHNSSITNYSPLRIESRYDEIIDRKESIKRIN